jgi:hypothetical protein
VSNVNSQMLLGTLFMVREFEASIGLRRSNPLIAVRMN